MAERTEPADSRIEWRIGVNVGDVIIDEGDIYGDGVNIAARLEAMAEPGGICISRTVLTETRGKLDFPVEDLGEQALKNIAQRVHVFRVLAEQKPMPEPAALPLPDKPSIAVLPFQNIGGDPEQEYFADGMVEEIITALSRIRWLFVIARNSSFTYKGQAVDVKQVGRELGVLYVLEGSVRRGGNRVRITGQLIDAETGTHLWADRFDGLIEDVFELQDKIAASVAGVIEPTLQAAEQRRSAARPTADLGAYDLYLRALAVFWPITKERIFEALGLFEQAIAIDRHYGPALAWAAICHLRLVVDGWAEAPETTRRKSAISLGGAPGEGETTRTSSPTPLSCRPTWRGYRCHDRAGRPCAGAQPELRPRLVSERRSQGLGRSTRSRDRACRDLAEAEPARTYRYASVPDGSFLFL